MPPAEVVLVRARRGSVVHATALTGQRFDVALCGRAINGYYVDEGPLTCAKCLEVQRTKPSRAVKQDVSGHWAGKIKKLADRLGYHRDELSTHWSQIALQIEYETRLARALSEAQAYRLLEACVDKTAGAAQAS